MRVTKKKYKNLKVDININFVVYFVICKYIKMSIPIYMKVKSLISSKRREIKFTPKSL